jgi:hypothetical protein
MGGVQKYRQKKLDIYPLPGPQVPVSDHPSMSSTATSLTRIFSPTYFQRFYHEHWLYMSGTLSLWLAVPRVGNARHVSLHIALFRIDGHT